MIGTMASLLSRARARAGEPPTIYDDALQDELYNNHRVIAPIWRLNDNRRVVRISAQVYNSLPQYEKLATRWRKNSPRAEVQGDGVEDAAAFTFRGKGVVAAAMPQSFIGCSRALDLASVDEPLLTAPTTSRAPRQSDPVSHAIRAV